VFTVAVLPWCFARLKRYQHGGYVFAGERTELRAGTRRFYGLAGRLIGMLVLVIGVIVSLVVLLTLWLGGGPTASRAVAAMSSIAFGYVLLPLVLIPYATASMQNLVWSRTRSRHTRFRSELSFDTLFRVNALNWLLIVLTLGLYWPFAQVRTARTRLEAMALQVKGDVKTWMARALARQGGVLGDAAGDAFDIDLGL